MQNDELKSLIDSYLEQHHLLLHGKHSKTIYAQCRQFILQQHQIEEETLKPLDEQLLEYVSSQRNSEWFRHLRKRKRDQFEEPMKPTTEFIGDVHVLLHILSYLDLSTLFLLRQVDRYFVQLLEKHFVGFATPKHIPIIEIPMHWLSSDHNISCYNQYFPSISVYKQLCCIAGLHHKFLRPQCSKNQHPTIQFIELFNETNSKFTNLIHLVLNQFNLDRNCSVDCGTLLLHIPTLIYSKQCWVEPHVAVNTPLYIFSKQLHELEKIQSYLYQFKSTTVVIIAVKCIQQHVLQRFKMPKATVFLYSNEGIYFRSEKCTIFAKRIHPIMLAQGDYTLNQEFLDSFCRTHFYASLRQEPQLNNFFQQLIQFYNSLHEHPFPMQQLQIKEK